MSATKLIRAQYLQNLFDAIYGPYRKLRSLEFRVARHGQSVESRSLDSLASDQMLIPGCSVRIDHEVQVITVKTKSQVEKLGILGWTSIWNGHEVLDSEWPIELRLPAKTMVRVVSGDQQVAFGGQLVEVKDPEASGVDKTMSREEFMAWLKRTTESILVHGLLFLALMNLDKIGIEPAPVGIELEDLSKKTTEVRPAMSGDFGGSGIAMSQGSGQVASGPSASDRVAKMGQGVATKLSGLAARLSQLSFGGSVAINVGKSSNSGQMAAAHSLQNSLGRSQGTGLNSSMQKLGSGVIGKGMELSIYGNSGAGVSQGDVEEMMAQVRALQGELRNCYETALMKDSSISVTIRYESEVTSSGTFGSHQFDFVGTIGPEGQSYMTSCMSGVLSKVHVSRKLSGNKVKVPFIFKS